MHALYINGSIDSDTVSTFFTEFNKFPVDEQLLIYITSDGGYSAVGDTITNLINKNANRITLIASGFIESAAFNIFFFSKCKREILLDTVGMVHYARCSIEITQNGKPYTDGGKMDLHELKRSAPSTFERLKREIGLNTKELKLIKEGEDCYFSYPRLKQLLKYAENKKAR